MAASLLLLVFDGEKSQHYRKICLFRVNTYLPCASRLTEHGKELFAVGARKRSRQRKPHGRSDAERTAKKPARQNKQKAHGKRKILGKEFFVVRRASLHSKPVDQDLPRFPNISREKNSRRAANSRALKQFAGNTMPCGWMQRTSHLFAVRNGKRRTAHLLFAVSP